MPPMNPPSSRQLRPATFLHRDSRLARMARPLAQFLRVEAAGGVLLAVAAAVALVWANSPWRAGYEALWATPVDISVGSFHLAEDLHGVVNDGLMAIFFFVVGLEIKREWTVGELRDRRQAALPAMAALGGMIVPALIYLAFNTGGPEGRGWGIPMATDIAFAVGVMALLGRRVPPPLKVFLLTLAIVDDLGAIVVIAVVYSDDLAPGYLLIAAAVVAAVAVLRRMHVTYPPIFVAAGIGLWLCLHESGVHATIAGVVMGLLTPAVPLQPDLQTQAVVDALENRDELTVEEVRATAAAIKGSVSIAERVGELLHPWSSYVIVPLFALANAGIVLQRDALTGATSVFVGVGAGPHRRQMRRCHRVRLADHPPRRRPTPARCRVGPVRRRRRARRHRLHRVAVHHRARLHRRPPRRRRQAGDPRRLDPGRRHRCARPGLRRPTPSRRV